MLWLLTAQVLSVLGPLQEDAPQQARELIEKFRSDKVEEREEAWKKLKVLGKSVVPELEKAAKNSDTEVAARAKELLRAIDLRTKLTPELLKSIPGIEDRLAHGTDHEWTRVLLEEKDELDEKDLEFLFVPALRGAETNPEKSEVLSVAFSRKPPFQGAIPEIKKVLGDPYPCLRHQAAYILLNMKAQEELPNIVKLLDDPHWCVRLWVARGLADYRIVKAAPEIAKKLLQDPEAQVKSTALRALGTLGYTESIPLTRRLLGDPDSSVRIAAALALADLNAKEAAREISVLCQDREWDVRWVAVRALERLGTKEEAPAVIPLLKDSKDEVKVAAARCLCEFGLPDGVPLLLKGYQNLSALNALRRPEIWRRLEGKTVNSTPGASRGEILGVMAKEVGISIDQEGDSAWLKGRPAGRPRGTDAIAFLALFDGNHQPIVETNTLRIVSPEEASRFWTSWWEAEKKK